MRIDIFFLLYCPDRFSSWFIYEMNMLSIFTNNFNNFSNKYYPYFCFISIRLDKETFSNLILSRNTRNN